MSSSSMTGSKDRINMIWWEAIRLEENTPVDLTQSVCVKRSDVKQFLGKALKKMGVHDNELNAFIKYWYAIFKNDYDSKNTPYILIEPIKASDLKKYIPDMQVEGKEANSFALERFYFRFERVANAAKGMDAESYLNGLKPRELGDNVVIDLGGELAKSPHVQVKKKWEGAAAFNEAFIKKYIFANS